MKKHMKKKAPEAEIEDLRTKTICIGPDPMTRYKGHRMFGGRNCPKQAWVKAERGVLEPRCPECYAELIANNGKR